MERTFIILVTSLLMLGCQFKMDISSGDESQTPDASYRLQNTVTYQDVFYTKNDVLEIELLDKKADQVMLTADENCSTGTWQSYQNGVQYSIDQTLQGVQTVFLKAMRTDGSETPCHKIRFVRDVMAPSMATISVAADTSWAGIEYVRSGMLSFNATAVDTLPVEMKISSDNTCSGGQWQEFLPASIYNSSLQHDEALRLYVKYRDKLENETACISSNEVRRDSEGPSITANSLLVAGLALAEPVEIYDRLINLSLSASDPVLSEMKISNNASCAGAAFEPYATSKANWDSGLDEESSLSVVFRDRLGNLSTCVTLHLKKISGGPTGTLNLAEAVSFDGLSFIPTPNVQLNISATGTSEMRFFNDSSCSASAGAWEPLAANKNWSFAAGDGVKEVGIQFRDASGAKTSSCISASAILDSVAPVDAQVIPTTEYFSEGRFYTKSSAVDFNLSATDVSLAHYEVSVGSSCGDGSTKQSFASVHSQALPDPSGVYVYSFQFFDIFDRASLCITRSIIKDKAPGSAPVLASLLEGALGSLNETPRLFLKGDSEVQNASQSGIGHYELRMERVGTGIVLPWMNVGKKESFAISGLLGNTDLGTIYQSSFVMIEGEDYRIDLRSVDNLGNVSPETSVTFKAKPAPIFLKPAENAPTSTAITREFKAVGVGAGTQFSATGGAKICKQPCDLGSAQSSILLEEGATYIVGYTVGAAGAYTVELTVGGSADTQTSSKWHLSTANLCPENYVLIPGDAGQRVQSFCLAKFEMKDVAGLAVSQALLEPWTYINRADSEAACAVSGGRLPTSREWNLTALDIAKQDVNWSFSVEGDRLRLNSGVSTGSGIHEVADELEHCDGAGTSCGTSWAEHKRTHTLSTGETIWDFAGNAWEITSSEFSEGIYTSEYWPVVSLDLSSIFSFILVGGQDLRCYQPYNNSYCGMGRAWLNNADVSGQAIYRGGSSNNGSDTGIFTVDFDYDPTHTGPQHGFRCARSLP